MRFTHTPDPRARKGQQENPLHQSDLDQVHVGHRYFAGSDAVWAGTVVGTAGHMAQEDRYRHGEVREPEHYWQRAKDAEEECGRRIRYFKTDNGRSYREGEAEAVKKLAGHIERCAIFHDKTPLRMAKVVSVEQKFLFCDPETQVWYEGTCDLLVRLGDLLIPYDWKFGGRPPAIETSPQPDVYCLAMKQAWWSDCPDIPGVHQVDWSKAENVTRYDEWPQCFYFVHVPQCGENNPVGGLIPFTPYEARCWAYLRHLTARYFAEINPHATPEPVAAIDYGLED